jgi:hypothetical protein
LAALREHLQSLQFPGEPPPTEDELAGSGLSLARFTGGWVAAGQPRWKAYAIYLSSFIGGTFLAAPTGPGALDLFLFIGVAFVALGCFGVAETIRGKRFPRP